MNKNAIFLAIGVAAALALIVAPSTLTNIALAKPPKLTTDTTTEPVNGGLTETTTTITSCANKAGNGPQAANCPGGGGIEEEVISQTCDVKNKAGHEPGGHNPC
jgi:hypothetical protein